LLFEFHGRNVIPAMKHDKRAYRPFGSALVPA
jgi:hypothetical protein